MPRHSDRCTSPNAAATSHPRWISQWYMAQFQCNKRGKSCPTPRCLSMQLLLPCMPARCYMVRHECTDPLDPHPTHRYNTLCNAASIDWPLAAAARHDRLATAFGSDEIRLCSPTSFAQLRVQDSLGILPRRHTSRKDRNLFGAWRLRVFLQRDSAVRTLRLPCLYFCPGAHAWPSPCTPFEFLSLSLPDEPPEPVKSTDSKFFFFFGYA